MKHALIALACMAAAAGAHATFCPVGTLNAGAGAPTWPDNCNTPQGGGSSLTPSTASSSSSSTASTGSSSAHQRQGQQQGQLQTATGGAGGAGGNATATGGTGGAGGSSLSQANGNGAAAGANAGSYAGSGNSNGQVVNVNTGGDSYRALALAMPSVPATPPSAVAGAILTTTPTGCGPLQRVVAEAVYGDYRGMFSHESVYLGHDEHTEMYLDENGQPAMYIRMGDRFYGHQVIYTSGALGVAAGSNISIGGWGSSGAGGNGGGGVSGAMQRIVTTVQLRLCDAGSAVVVVPTAPPAPVRSTVLHRKPRPRPVAPTCTNICKAVGS